MASFPSRFPGLANEFAAAGIRLLLEARRKRSAAWLMFFKTLKKKKMPHLESLGIKQRKFPDSYRHREREERGSPTDSIARDSSKQHVPLSTYTLPPPCTRLSPWGCSGQI